jgi:hypothetical protein
VTQDKCFVLDRCLRHALGVMPAGSAVAECGVFKGGTAYLLASILQGRGIPLHLFDTFSGIPESSGCDATAVGDLANTSVESVRRFLKPFDLVDFHPGLIPDTFAGLKEQQFGFVHVDVDTYRTTVHCCEYFWPRLLPGGVMVFDDYVLPGQRQAVDEFFASRTEVPMPMRSGQAMVVRHPRPVQ